MSPYTFKLAALSDKTKIIEFLDANWGEKHPLLHLEDMFEFYYASGDSLHFAYCEEDGKIVAAVGYILANKSEAPDIWVSIWCAQKGKNGTGLELMSALPSLTGARVMACNNIREKTMVFYSFLGYTAERLPHYYRLADKAEYKVARIAKKRIRPVQSGNSLVHIDSVEMLNRDYTPDKALVPYKDLWYLARRYFNYPRQHYDVWGLYENGKAAQLLVTRTTKVDGVNILRIVDYIGKRSAITALGYGINELIISQNAEYADMYCYGICPKTMAKAGFCERVRDDENIIPNYLNPPLYENTEYFFFTSQNKGFTMFKADGDQDRPNITV